MTLRDTTMSLEKSSPQRRVDPRAWDLTVTRVLTLQSHTKNWKSILQHLTTVLFKAINSELNNKEPCVSTMIVLFLCDRSSPISWRFAPIMMWSSHQPFNPLLMPVSGRSLLGSTRFAVFLVAASRKRKTMASIFPWSCHSFYQVYWMNLGSSSDGSNPTRASQRRTLRRRVSLSHGNSPWPERSNKRLENKLCLPRRGHKQHHHDHSSWDLWAFLGLERRVPQRFSPHFSPNHVFYQWMGIISQRLSFETSPTLPTHCTGEGHRIHSIL